jgi:hypothetical protein
MPSSEGNERKIRRKPVNSMATPPPTVPSYNANSTSPGGAVGLRVAGGEDGPAVWQAVFAQGAIEHQLVAGGPHQRRRGVQFVEAQDAGTCPALPNRRIDRINQAKWRGYRSGGCPALWQPGRPPGICRRPVVPRGRRACRSCASTCSEDAISDGFMHGDLHDGLPWSLLPATDPSRISRSPLTLPSDCRRASVSAGGPRPEHRGSTQTWSIRVTASSEPDQLSARVGQLPMRSEPS